MPIRRIGIVGLVYKNGPRKNQVEQPFASIPAISFLQLIAFPQRPFLERFTRQS
jgi:hypothetical protein